MELQLGLALPTHSSIEGFDPYNSDLNNHIRCSKNKKYFKNKRSFEESFGDFSKPLPLLVWSVGNQMRKMAAVKRRTETFTHQTK